MYCYVSPIPPCFCEQLYAGDAWFYCCILGAQGTGVWVCEEGLMSLSRHKAPGCSIPGYPQKRYSSQILPRRMYIY